MLLWIRNLYRRLLRKKPVTNLYFDEKIHKPTEEVWDNIDLHNDEAILICINRTEIDTSNRIKCFAKVSPDSSMLSLALGEFIKKINDE